MKAFKVTVTGAQLGSSQQCKHAVVVAADVENVLIKVRDSEPWKKLAEASTPEIIRIERLENGVHWL